jgi:NAD(P)-dependent dehydrogenase (short-subunit alcohol dehydrogenase family)
VNITEKTNQVKVRLNDKVALVTGGGRGIGRAISFAFALEGAAVAMADRSVSQLELTEKELRSRARNVLAIQTDVASEEQVQQMVARTLEKYGKIDILVNNSGITGPIAPVFEMKLEAWNETLAVNLTGAMLCSREVLKHMIPRKSGTIINIGSEGGRGGDGKSGRPNRGAYCCSKMGLIGLTETMAVEVGEYGIRVNAISPGAVSGERLNNLLKARAQAAGVSLDELKAKILMNYSLIRIPKEPEVASVAVFLASNEASAITGQVIAVNCGHHITY